MGKESNTGSKFMVDWRHVALIDREIRSGSYPSAPELARRLELSARTVKRRIEFMRYDRAHRSNTMPPRRGITTAKRTGCCPRSRSARGSFLP
jgi:hypothetical protein